ncbi:hypothetical protein [Ligilactobacillus murinus]|uniref:Uncharacterized protein n=1 Tax=Ligilactobacillus murinus TaxID=1622 RepID=A0AAE7BRH0_9LACO|nr:hypothetical protein [Ligilactobacillus murinus]NEF83232.1 hypothetical protein [Ligilactobacillus murinus]NEF85384.1 hypothetical protein [Ligilactobacillus murinus]NEF87785.1 hypothetical protein [Ligilactobacillus murinus]NEF90081.1 hypothetical protein [Ligilactobacillus murinus]NEF92352.1 hypothetical protein [Ligilactobacillus murinus]
MKEITVRKNKSYTSILINVASRKNFLQAYELQKELKTKGVNSVVKPSKQGAESYLNVYKPVQRMQETPVGHHFEIMGVAFKKLKREYDHLTKLELTSENNVRVDVSNNSSLIEDVYHAVTGGLLFF